MAKQPIPAPPRSTPPPMMPAPTNGNGFTTAMNPVPSSVWPIPGDAPDLQAIIQAQAETIEQNEALLHGYQTDLNTAQNPPSPAPTTGTGTGNGTQLNVTAATGTIVRGAVVADTNNVTVPLGTTILGQISGTVGGAGLYLTNNPTTANGTALTFTAPPPPSSWPLPTDAPTLNLIVQNQTAVIRVQTALMQHYQDLLNNSQTTPPPTGP